MFLKTRSVDRPVNLDVKETTQKIKKTKPEIKKKLGKLITSGKSNENTDMQENVNNCATNGERLWVTFWVTFVGQFSSNFYGSLFE